MYISTFNFYLQSRIVFSHRSKNLVKLVLKICSIYIISQSKITVAFKSALFLRGDAYRAPLPSRWLWDFSEPDRGVPGKPRTLLVLLFESAYSAIANRRQSASQKYKTVT